MVDDVQISATALIADKVTVFVIESYDGFLESLGGIVEEIRGGCSQLFHIEKVRGAS